MAIHQEVTNLLQVQTFIQNYVLLMKPNTRHNLTKFRIGTQHLEIERGCFTKPKAPPECRICKLGLGALLMWTLLQVCRSQG